MRPTLFFLSSQCLSSGTESASLCQVVVLKPPSLPVPVLYLTYGTDYGSLLPHCSHPDHSCSDRLLLVLCHGYRLLMPVGGFNSGNLSASQLGNLWQCSPAVDCMFYSPCSAGLLYAVLLFNSFRSGPLLNPLPRPSARHITLKTTGSDLKQSVQSETWVSVSTDLSLCLMFALNSTDLTDWEKNIYF